jgi:hypothetical protein
MAGSRLAARLLAVLGVGFAIGLAASELPSAGADRTETAPSVTSLDRPVSSSVGSSTEVSAEPVLTSTTPEPGRQLTGAMQFEARYDFDVTVDARGRAQVIERLAATNRTARPIRHLDLFVLPNFDAAGFREFKLGSIRVNGAAPETRWTRDGANLRVELPKALQPGRNIRVVVLFSLAPGRPTGGDLAAALSRSRDLVQFLLWYPMLSDGHGAYLDSDGSAATPASPITYVIRTEAPVAFAVPGTVTKRTDREVRGSLERARDFAFAIGRGVRAWSGRSQSGVGVTVYAPARAAGSKALALATSALDRFAELLDTPYPAAGLVVVGGSMNMESSGIVFLDADHLEDEYTVAHEVAHEWFHWLVGNDQLREPWLDEAFATYLGGGLVPRHADGFCSRLPVNQPVWRFASADPKVTWQRCDDYMETIYYKGSWLVHAVRMAMGDAAFLASLKEYLAKFRFQVATTADIVAIWRAHSDAVTGELIGRWLDLRARTAGARRPVYPRSRWASSMSSWPVRA